MRLAHVRERHAAAGTQWRLAAALDSGGLRWLDLEDDAEEVGDREVENFPTILVERDGAELFYGPLLPHHEHLRRLLQSLETA